MNKDPIRIILIDDHQLARESWNLLLSYDGRFSVVAECDNGHSGIEQTRLLNPDIILLDINMQPVNGFEVTKKILLENPSAKIIGISVNNLPSYASRMLEIGAKGFITKGTSFQEVAQAIIEVYEGKTYLCTEIKKMIS